LWMSILKELLRNDARRLSQMRNCRLCAYRQQSMSDIKWGVL